jgi:PAS domain-containing protein
MDAAQPPSAANGFHGAHAALLLASYERLLGRPLLELALGEDPGRALYEAPFVLLSHRTEADPIFNYANRSAQVLFGYPWEAFVGLPSRLSAEPVAREERERLLRRVADQGFIDDYAGVRVAADGRRFRIEQAVVWNLVDETGTPQGQAACFHHWRPLQSRE